MLRPVRRSVWGALALLVALSPCAGWAGGPPAETANLRLAQAAPTANLSAARSRIMFARDSAKRGQTEDAERKLQEAEKYIEGGTEAETAPLRAEIAAAREEIARAVAEVNAKALKRAGEQVEKAKAAFADEQESAAQSALKYAEQIARDVPEADKADLLAEIDALRARIAGGAAPAPAPTAQPTPAASAADLPAARGRIVFARDSAKRGQAADAERKLQEAEKYLEGGTEAETAPLRAEIAAIRAELAKAGQAKPAPAAAQPAATAAPSTANLSSARSRVMFARESLQRGQASDAERKLQEAEKYLEGGTEQETAPLRAEIAAIRAELEKADAAQHAKVVQRARDKLTVAKKLFADGSEDDARATLDDADKLLAPLPDAAKADAAAELAAFRASLPAPKSAEARNLEDRLNGQINIAEGNISSDPRFAEENLRRVEGWLDDAENRRILGDETVRALAARVAEVRTKLGGSRAAAALDRAADPLVELEQALAADPYGDADERTAHTISTDLEYLATRARAALDGQSAAEPEVAAMLARIDAAAAKLQQYGDAWSRRRDIARLVDGWALAKSYFADWQAEAPPEPGLGLNPWMMQQTALAIRDTRQWLGDAANAELLDRYKDDAAVAALLAEASQLREAAAAKLNAAFNASFDDAERRPLPDDTYTLSQPDAMAGEALAWFAETDYAEPNAARARKLGERWRAEIAAIEARVAAELKRMTEEANAAWPKIDAGIEARNDFDPERAAEFQGETVRLRGIRNRARWDFGGEYAFAMWSGEAAVAGDYAEHVLAAMRQAAERVRFIDDHTDWDVIAVVEGGKCRIRKRVFTTVIDQKTRDEIAKIESYHPIDCIKVRVIGLHAGPVAVGP